MLRFMSRFSAPRKFAVVAKRSKATMRTGYDVEAELAGLDNESPSSVSIPFARAKIGNFQQEPPHLGNQFLEDTTVRSFLKRHMPPKVFDEVALDLERFGLRVATDVYVLGLECERNPPSLRHYDAWGKRVDEIVTCEAWRKQKEVAAEEGLVAIAYERKHQQWSRLHQMAKMYLYNPSSGLYSCPLAMTDGAAKSLEVIGDRELMEHAYSRLTSRDPQRFWTSGQWMTERRGGSDVALGTETLAVEQADGSYKLYGYKWFSSATDSDMSLTLARIVDKQGQTMEGTRGLAMFYLETRKQDRSLNGIEVQRLKEKLGTRQLPTAELLLDGTRAHKVSADGRGVACISNMLTVSRLHNAVSSASSMRRMVNLARDYSTRRSCFGKIIRDHPLHMKILAHMEVETRAATLLALEMSRIQGLQDCGLATDHQLQVYRLLIPIMKLYTAKQAVAVASEGLESFGGAGYLEDTNLPQILRDAQVLPIWEGTTNILSLDVLRALSKSEGESLKSLHTDIIQRLEPVKISHKLSVSVGRVESAASDVVDFAHQNISSLELAARDFAFSLARTYMGMLLLEHANWSEATSQDALTANRWCEQDLVPVLSHLRNGRYGNQVSKDEFELVFDGYGPRVDSKSKL